MCTAALGAVRGWLFSSRLLLTMGGVSIEQEKKALRAHMERSQMIFLRGLCSLAVRPIGPFWSLLPLGSFAQDDALCFCCRSRGGWHLGGPC